MTFKKLEMTNMRKYYERALTFTEKARWDPSDPTTDAMAMANNTYAAMTGAGLAELIDGMNDLLERVDRVEQMLKAQTRPR